LLALYLGIVVAPDIIPLYDLDLWWNPFAWTYRALIVNEFRSARYENPDQELINLGFVLEDGEAFGQEWVGYSFLYLVPYLILCSVGTGLGLTYVRNAGGAAPPDPTAEQTKRRRGGYGVRIDILQAGLVLSDICYKSRLPLVSNWAFEQR
jgi:hypothetical protein